LGRRGHPRRDERLWHAGNGYAWAIRVEDEGGYMTFRCGGVMDVMDLSSDARARNNRTAGARGPRGTTIRIFAGGL
jgi:hypothetical protein